MKAKNKSLNSICIKILVYWYLVMIKFEKHNTLTRSEVCMRRLNNTNTVLYDCGSIGDEGPPRCDQTQSKNLDSNPWRGEGVCVNIDNKTVICVILHLNHHNQNTTRQTNWWSE